MKFRKKFNCLPVNCKVQAHQFCELWIVKAQHFGVVGRPIQIRVDRTDFTILECVTVDGGCNDWQFGNQIHAVFIGGIPIFGLVYTLKRSNKEQYFHSVLSRIFHLLLF